MVEASPFLCKVEPPLMAGTWSWSATAQVWVSLTETVNVRGCAPIGAWHGASHIPPPHLTRSRQHLVEAACTLALGRLWSGSTA
jgi:hypothetical protein